MRVFTAAFALHGASEPNRGQTAGAQRPYAGLGGQVALDEPRLSRRWWLSRFESQPSS